MTTTTYAPELNSGIWTTWLPITTAYSSQAGCQTAAWARSGIQASYGYWPYIYDPAYDSSVANSLTCLPPAVTSWWNNGITVDGTITSYSLGPVTCPAAYETVSTILVSGRGGESTSVICCPTSFEFVRNLPDNVGIDGVCTSPMSSGQVFTYASPARNSYISATTTLLSSMPLMAVPVEGYNFAVVTTSSQKSGSSTNLPASSPTSSNTTTSTGSSDLSSGAKTGLGVGVGVGGLALVLLAVAVFYIRRRSSSRQIAYAPAPTELADNSGNKGERLVVVNNGPHELGGASRPTELPGRDM